MEMWLTRSTLVVLLTAAAVLVISGQDPVILDEKIRKVNVPSGSPLTFHCRLRTESHSRLRVAWHFKRSLDNGSLTILHEEMVNKSAKTSTVAPNKTKQDSQDEGRDTGGTLSMYTLSNATEDNSGWYFCKVTIEIPSLIVKISNGTKVNISVSPTDSLPVMDRWMWIIVGVSAFILIVLLLTCVCLRRRKRRNRGEDPVYANTRPRQPSPRPGMDNLKMAPSSQNLRHPSPSRTYDDGKRRYKDRKSDGTSQTTKSPHHHHRHHHHV